MDAIAVAVGIPVAIRIVVAGSVAIRVVVARPPAPAAAIEPAELSRELGRAHLLSVLPRPDGISEKDRFVALVVDASGNQEDCVLRPGRLCLLVDLREND